MKLRQIISFRYMKSIVIGNDTGFVTYKMFLIVLSLTAQI